MSARTVKSKPLPLSKQDKAQAVSLIRGLAANPVRIEQDRNRDALARELYDQVIYPDPKVRARLKRAPEGDYRVIHNIGIAGAGINYRFDGLKPLGLRMRDAERAEFGGDAVAKLNWEAHRALIERIREHAQAAASNHTALIRIEYQLKASINALRHHADLVAAFPDYATEIRKAIPLRYPSDSNAVTVPVQSIMCAIAKLQGVEREGCTDTDAATQTGAAA